MRTYLECQCGWSKIVNMLTNPEDMEEHARESRIERLLTSQCPACHRDGSALQIVQK